MEVKERIIAETSKLFLQFGIRAITMDSIARHMGISKRTIYELIGDKDNLLAECLHYFQQKKEQENLEIINSNLNTIEVFFTFLNKGVEAMKSINPLFFIDLKKYHYNVWHKNIKQNDARNQKETAKLLQKGIDEQLIRNDINIDIVTKILFEQMHILGNEEVFPADKYAKAEIFENIIVNFVRGISTMKGQGVIDVLLDNYKKSKQ